MINGRPLDEVAGDDGVERLRRVLLEHAGLQLTSMKEVTE